MFIKSSCVFVIVYYNYVSCYVDDFASNVGTVLFKSSNIFDDDWDQEQIILLEVRKLLQSLIPPIDIIATIDDDYAKNILHYFLDAYASIKREIDDFENDRIVTTALSDAVGGYMKMWVLPAVRYGYYSGVVSYDNANNLIIFYNYIKRYLNTKGKGWRNPSTNMLNFIQISSPTHKHHTRSMNNPCEHLALYEKADTHYTVPIPTLYWNGKTATMFLPLKEKSLVSLSSPKSENLLSNYYDVAVNCIQESRPEELKSFKNKFQEWLHLNVVPHLNDEDIYAAFDNVIGLLDDTKDLCHEVIDTAYSNQVSNTTTFVLTTSQIIFFIIILIIELTCFIPLLIYLSIYKTSRNRGGLQFHNLSRIGKSKFNISTLFHCNKNEKSAETITEHNSRSTIIREQVVPFRKKHVSTSTKSTYNSKNLQLNVPTFSIQRGNKYIICSDYLPEVDAEIKIINDENNESILKYNKTIYNDNSEEYLLRRGFLNKFGKKNKKVDDPRDIIYRTIYSPQVNYDKGDDILNIMPLIRQNDKVNQIEVFPYIQRNGDKYVNVCTTKPLIKISIDKPKKSNNISLDVSQKKCRYKKTY